MARDDFSNARSDKRPLARLRASVNNALELAHFDRLIAEYSAPFDVVDRGPHHRLRRYSGAPEGAPVVLLVPPLMVRADVYDIAPDVSAVRALIAHGIAPWVVDFGAPEHETGGLERTFDDHIRAVAQAVASTRALTGKSVHLCGYCQGGLFAYQTAAYFRCEGVASIVTFASPVDLHKSIPAFRSDLLGAFHQALHPVTKKLLSRVEAVPAKGLSIGFRLASSKKNLKHRVEFLRSLHDRERTMKREAQRRFLGGAGFVAWPGPAFRAVVEDYWVHNRMLAGGFVVDGRTLSLADLTCPILAFVGMTDEIARPATVRAIVEAAPNADVRLEPLSAGHMGLIVGSRAQRTTWPTVAAWVSAIERGASASDALPEGLVAEAAPEVRDEKISLLREVTRQAARNMWRSLGDMFASANDVVEAVRWQEGRLRRLARMKPDTPVSASRELARRAKKTPTGVFFLWRGRAFSYAEADARVTNVARALHARGVRRGERVGVFMGSRPSLLSAATALGRLGAVAVLAPPTAAPAALARAFERLGVRRVIVDPERSVPAATLGLELSILGGGQRSVDREDRTFADGRSSTIDLETIDPSSVPLPADLNLDPGRARDVSIVFLRDAEGLGAVPITNHRWALSALGAAAACAIKPADTVLCGVPLHHPTGMLVSAGSALVSGARFALLDADQPLRLFDAQRFLLEIRRVGATVVFYAGEMLRPLLDEPASPTDRRLPVRIFAGSGMRPALAARIRERFGVDTMEFYAGAAHRAILADPRGDAPGALGGVLPGSSEVAFVKCDLVRRTHVLDPEGRLLYARMNEPALIAVRVSEEEIETLGDARTIVRDAFGDGSAWLVTADVIERDSEGRLWFVDSLSGFVATKDGRAISTRRVEDAFYTLPEVRLAAVWETANGTGELGAAFVSSAAIPIDRVACAMLALPVYARPAFIARVAEIPLTEGFRPNKHATAALAFAAEERWHVVPGGRKWIRSRGPMTQS